MVAPLDSPDAFVVALRHAGAEVQLGDEQGQSVLELIPQPLHLSDEKLWIYSSSEKIDSSQVSAAFADAKGQQFVWANEYLILQYTGNDGGTILLVDGILGEALIKPSAAGDEPYPPAIPATIRVIATEFGGQPAEIEVIAYEMKEWSDACLDLGEPGEDCPDVITTGWRIELRFEALEIEAHTDLLGESVRWRSH
jgi:hypothetical protein